MARSFNGINDALTIPYAATDAFNGGSAISVSCWFKGSDATSCVRLQTNDSVFVLIVWNTTQSIMSNDGSVGGALNWNAAINNGNWHHLGLSWSQSGSRTIYRDGAVEATTGASATALPTFTNTYLATIGRYSGGGEQTNGSVADVGLWNVALTAGEMAGLAQGIRPNKIRPAALKTYYPLDGLQTPEPDLSGFANNCILVGAGAVFAAGPPITLFTTRNLIYYELPPGIFIRPDADSIDGSWTNETNLQTNLFASIDEVTADDADYIISSNNPVNDIVKLSLSNPGVTVAMPVTVSYRYCKRGEVSLAVNLTVDLLQGVTSIASWSHTDIGTTFTTVNQSLTSPQFAAITDFNDLYLQFNASV